jgi:hypothetical protein
MRSGLPPLSGCCRVRPKVSSYTGDLSLLLFTTKAKAADGRSITRTVRVVAGPDGKIKKATTSR